MGTQVIFACKRFRKIIYTIARFALAGIRGVKLFATIKRVRPMTLPAHAPTDVTRKQAQQAAGFGLPQDQIGALLGISDVTLRKNYSEELALGRAMASAAVGESLFRRAVSGEDTTAAIWWSKCQMRWSPPPAVVEVSGLISISAALADASLRLASDAIDGTCTDVADPAD